MLIYALLILNIFCIVSARRNVTLDDDDPAIVYHGLWLLTPYDPLNAGGNHVVTVNADSYATLTFLGVAIYFYSPLWPFRVTTAVSIDGETPQLLDLRDYDVPYHQDGPETAPSQIVWYVENMPNRTHTLNVSVGNGEDLAILDTLVYTILGPNDGNSTSSTASHMVNTRTLSMISTPTYTPTSTNSSPSSKTGLSITLGLVCSIFGSLVFWALYWFWRRHRRRVAEEESANSDDPNPNMSQVTTRPRYPKTGLQAAYLGKRIGSDKRRGNAPLPPRRSKGPRSVAIRGTARKHLSTIPELSGDQDVDEDEDSASQGSTASTSPDTSPSTSFKNNGPDDWTVSSSPLTVRLVTDNNHNKLMS